MNIRVSNQVDAAKAFKAHGIPNEIYSSVGSYRTYDSSYDNDVFDEAMNMLYYADSIVLVYHNK